MKGRLKSWKGGCTPIRWYNKLNVSIPAESFSFCCRCRLDLQKAMRWSVKYLHMRADQEKAAGQTVSETWRCSGVEGAPAGVLLLDHLLGLLQLCRVSVVSSPQILHMSHHQLDCPAHSGLLSKTVKLHVEPHWLNDITNDECILDYFGLPGPHLIEGTHFKWS